MTPVQQMRQILAEMSLLSCGTTQSWNPSPGGPGEDRNPMPPGGQDSLPERWAARFADASGEFEQHRVIAEARHALEAERVQAPSSRPAGETPAQELARKTARVLALHADGAWTRAEIASDTRLTISQVRQIIATRALSAPVVSDGERAEQARVLREQNLSTRQIAGKLGVSHMTVSRLLRGKAA